MAHDQTALSNKTAQGAMSDKDFRKFSEFIYAEVGIKLPQVKKTMIEARLQKRIRALEMPSHRDYLAYLFSRDGLEKELINLIDVVTTNTTDFFREPQHFSYLSETVLPDWFAAHGPSHALRIWSAGCSLGMEPYTLAMVLSEFAEKNPGFSARILATDISSQVLQKAVRAVYDEDRVAPVPRHLKTKYLLRSKDRTQKLVRIDPRLRDMVSFERLNFMEPFTFKHPFDVIFCRNVVIYFDKQTQEKLFTKFHRVLGRGGHLFIGHSESLAGMNVAFRPVIPTVYTPA
ncbi:MAG: methyltransferase domain-containing protein [Desulfovibrionaceae bacterium]|nr:methyltransferase domain-containing protein [Desulfovibrionaceae bacterium]MBF0514156.1 methyltransferase domain-containing protein [Desulfovibrionaceae bacterium]